MPSATQSWNLHLNTQLLQGQLRLRPPLLSRSKTRRCRDAGEVTRSGGFNGSDSVRASAAVFNDRPTEALEEEA